MAIPPVLATDPQQKSPAVCWERLSSQVKRESGEEKPPPVGPCGRASSSITPGTGFLRTSGCVTRPLVKAPFSQASGFGGFHRSLAWTAQGWN